ncbi:hypothetical protein [Streptodolium elevatio]|uniref:WXG100 family type VII secretion target n=1 Tax=Streptodolium elevatio TaxID=3157996 RepID=A0ABV3DU67_9ACTN
MTEISSSADPARISARAHALAVAATRIDNDAVTLAAGVRSALTQWSGTAAAAFRSYAGATDASRIATSSALRVAAIRLEAHAEAVAAARARP